jgi:YbbR domain-containing protein
MLHRNLPLKAASLLLAIFLWFWVLLNVKNPILETRVKVGVIAEGLGGGAAPGRKLPTVEVRVRGLRQEMEGANRALHAFVSCRGLSPGEHRLEVKVRAPENVTVVGVRPPQIPVVLEEVVSESKPIETKAVEEPPPGYELGGWSVSRKTVTVSGPRSLVDRTASARVTIDLSSTVPDVPRALPVRALDSAGSPVGGLTLSPSTVNVRVSMKLVVSPRTVPVVVKTSGELPPGFEIAAVQVRPALATVLVPASRVHEVVLIETEELRLTGVRGSFVRTLALVLPDGVNLLTNSAVRVAVEVRKTETETADPSPASDEQPSEEPDS